MMTKDRIIEIIEKDNIKLLGQINLTEIEYIELIEQVKIIVKNMSPAVGLITNIYLSLALVQIAIREYKDGRYWSYFCGVMGENIPSSKLNYLGKVFAETVKKYGLLYFDRDDSSTQMYVENIKMHAFVTNAYLDGFYDFAYAYYENNLFRQIGEDLSDDLDLLASFMETTIDNNTDSIIGEESKGKTTKSYKLLKSSRTAMAIADTNTIDTLFRPVLTMIDKYYYDLEIPSNNDSRFSVGFSVWCREKEKREGSVDRKKGTRSISSRRPYITLDNKSMFGYLVIPPQKFRESECEGEISVQVEINGCKEDIELEVYKSFGIYISEEKKIPIPSIFDKINIIIESSIIKTYKIEQSCYRLFNRSMNTISRLNVGPNILLVDKGNDVDFDEYTDCIDKTDEFIAFDYYSLIASEDSKITVGNRTISVLGEYSEEPYFEDEIDQFNVYDYEGNKLLCSKTHPTVSFKVPQYKIAGTTLVVNGIRCPINKLKNKILYSDHQNGDIAVVERLEGEIPSRNGVFTVELDVPGENNKKICKYVLLPKIEINTTKSIYTKNDEVYIWVWNGHDCIFPVREDVELVGMKPNADEYNVPMTSDEDYVEFDLEINEILTIRVPLCIFRMGFSKDRVEYDYNTQIWYSNVRPTIYCQARGVDQVGIYVNHEKNNLLLGEFIGDGSFRFDLSEITERINKEFEDESWVYLNVYCSGDRKRNFNLLAVQRQLNVDPYFYLGKYNDSIGFDLRIDGEAELEVTIKNHISGEILVEKRKMSSGITVFPELVENEAYDIFPEMIETDFFGLTENVQTLRPIFNVTYVDKENLTDFRMTVTGVFYDEDKLKFSYEYYIDLRERIDTTVYEGNMFGYKKTPKHSSNGKFALDMEGRRIKKRLGRVRVEITSFDVDSIRYRVWSYAYPESEYDEEWIEFYYDKEQCTLLHNNDNALLRTYNLENFIFLDSCVTEYKSMIKKIRRI